MRGELLADRGAEVRGVLAHAIGGPLQDVFRLIAEIRGPGHAPVAQPGAIVLAVELAVEGIPRIALRRGPHLTGDLGMTRHRRDR